MYNTNYMEKTTGQQQTATQRYDSEILSTNDLISMMRLSMLMVPGSIRSVVLNHQLARIDLSIDLINL